MQLLLAAPPRIRRGARRARTARSRRSRRRRSAPPPASRAPLSSRELSVAVPWNSSPPAPKATAPATATEPIASAPAVASEAVASARAVSPVVAATAPAVLPGRRGVLAAQAACPRVLIQALLNVVLTPRIRATLTRRALPVVAPLAGPLASAPPAIGLRP